LSAIYDALVQLNEKVIGLEKAAETPFRKVQELQAKLQDGKKKGGKAAVPDLFSVAPAANKNASVGPLAYDPKLASRKVDMAIETIEKMLKEG
jgi:hypothetical protein